MLRMHLCGCTPLEFFCKRRRVERLRSLGRSVLAALERVDMKFSFARYSVPIIACWFLINAGGPTWGAEAANITSVQVAPDLKQITIRCDGPIGRHSAFVIRQPFRLVVDLESTGLGNIPRRISVARNPVSEIRIGYANSRARVVVDFGGHPVPSFKIYKQNNSLVVNLGIGAAMSQASPARKPAVDLRKAPPQPKVTAAGPAARKADSSAVSGEKRARHRRSGFRGVG